MDSEAIRVTYFLSVSGRHPQFQLAHSLLTDMQICSRERQDNDCSGYGIVGGKEDSWQRCALYGLCSVWQQSELTSHKQLLDLGSTFMGLC